MIKLTLKAAVIIAIAASITIIGCSTTDDSVGSVVADEDIPHAVTGGAFNVSGSPPYPPLEGVTIRVDVYDFNNNHWYRVGTTQALGEYYVSFYDSNYHPFPWQVWCTATKDGYGSDSAYFQDHYGGIHYWYPGLVQLSGDD